MKYENSYFLIVAIALITLVLLLSGCSWPQQPDATPIQDTDDGSMKKDDAMKKETTTYEVVDGSEIE